MPCLAPDPGKSRSQWPRTAQPGCEPPPLKAEPALTHQLGMVLGLGAVPRTGLVGHGQKLFKDLTGGTSKLPWLQMLLGSGWPP